MSDAGKAQRRAVRGATARLLASSALASAFVVGGASAATAAPPAPPSGVCANLGLVSVRLGLGPAGAPRCAVGEIKVCLGPISSAGCTTPPPAPAPEPDPGGDEPSA